MTNMESSNPDHYQHGAVECIDAMRSASTKHEMRGYLKLTIMKYLWRLGRKDDPAIEAEKILVYAGWLLNLERNEDFQKPCQKKIAASLENENTGHGDS